VRVNENKPKGKNTMKQKRQNRKNYKEKEIVTLIFDPTPCQEPVTRGEQLPCARVAAFSPTSLF